MDTLTSLLATDLPFHPTIIPDDILGTCKDYIARGLEPAFAVAQVIQSVMEVHVTQNLEPFLNSLSSRYGTTAADLRMLRLGYMYANSSLLASSIAIGKPYNDRGAILNELFRETLDQQILKIQIEVKKAFPYLNQLLALDNTGALACAHLEEKKPLFTNPYFMAGIKAFTIIFLGFINTQVIPEDLPEDPSNLG